MDIKTTFLHGDIEEEIYMKQPEGFAVKGKNRVGLQVEKVPIWVKAISKDVVKSLILIFWDLVSQGKKIDHCVYFKLVGDHFIYVVLYVDDMLLIGNNKEIIKEVKTQLSSKI
jgi:hypothetical protein